MKDIDLYWLAGILEGEGYFSYNGSATIALQMTDYDIVERANSLLGNRPIIELKSKNKAHKNSYLCKVHGQPAIDIMKELLPIMGKRRKDKIQSIIFRHETRTNIWSNKRILNQEQIQFIKNNLNKYRVSELVKMFGVKRYNISDIKRNKTGKNI